MPQIRVNPTRMELKKLQGRYTMARRGHKLLKDKRDELMKQFLDIVREAKALRLSVEKELTGIYASLSVAGATSNPRMLEEALLCPVPQASVSVTEKNLMSVHVPVFSSPPAAEKHEPAPYGFAFTSGELDASLHTLRELQESLIRLAEVEKATRLLAEEIERTRRRVNALEYIMMPQYLAAIKDIRMKLDEQERGNTTRLMKVKDMMLASQRTQSYSEEEEPLPAE